MPKLFVAVGLPVSTSAKLIRLQPPPTAGVRLVEASQMHLTLHFLGEADPERTAAALRAVRLPPFDLTLAGVGQFASAGGSATLWAGVRESAELRTLHAAVAAALAGEGFRPEARRYTPHVTLARCVPEAAAGVVEDFLAGNAGFLLSGVPVTAFGLYSSAFINNAPVYRCERSFPLSGEA
jgi:2'-5' RNA ligase